MTPDPDGMLCYCFGYRRRDIEAELLARGETTIPARIRTRIRAGDCACSSKNPAGTCCLGDVQNAVAEIRATLHARRPG